MEEKTTAPAVHELPKPTDRMAKARAALAQKRAADKLITLQREAEKIEKKIKDADDYSKTHPPIPIEQPMQLEETIQTPIINEEKTIENEKPPIQEEPIPAEPIQETKPMSSSEDIVITPISEENRIEAPKEKKRKRDSENIKKKKNGRRQNKREISSSTSEDEGSAIEREDIQILKPATKKAKLDPILSQPVQEPSIFSRISERAHQVSNGIRSIPIPDHVTNFARDTATNCGWACVVFAGVLLQRYAVKVGTNYLFPGGRYPGHTPRAIDHPPPMSTQQPYPTPSQVPTWHQSQQQQQTFGQPRSTHTPGGNFGWNAIPNQTSLRGPQGSVQGSGGGTPFLSR
jgi:hypothetical protein